MITKEKILERKGKLEKVIEQVKDDMVKVQKELNRLQGIVLNNQVAISECNVWLEEFENKEIKKEEDKPVAKKGKK